MPEFLKYSSNNSVTALFNPHLNPGGIFIVAHDGGLSLHETIRETDPLSELIQRGLRHAPLHASFIDPLETEARMHQLLGHLTVVRKDHEARRIPIESTNREVRSVVLCDELRYCFAPLRIAQR
jgi:hypothetical protein